MQNNLPVKARSILMLKKDESIEYVLKCEILDMDIQGGNPDMGAAILGGYRSNDVRCWCFSGYLILTTKRIIFIEKIMGIWGPKDEYNLRDVIDLENIQGMSIYKKFPWLRLGVKYQVQGIFHERGFKGGNLNEHWLNDLKLRIQRSMAKRLAEIEKEKKKERIQFIIDFSFLRKQLEKGGITLTVIKCPNCSGSVNVPDSGSYFNCQYCGSTIHATDIFEKMKGLIHEL